MTSHSVPLQPNQVVRVRTRSGRIAVHAEPRDDMLVEKGDVDPDAQTAVSGANNGSGAVELRVPLGTLMVIGTGSGSVTLDGSFGAVSITGSSGKVTVASAGALDVRTKSGSVQVGSCAGPCRVKTVSGQVNVGNAGETHIATVSGTIEVGDVSRVVRVHTVSGRVNVCCDGPADAEVKTMSGRVRLAYPVGVSPDAKFQSASGRTRCGCPAGEDCSVRVMTFSGNVEVVPR